PPSSKSSTQSAEDTARSNSKKKWAGITPRLETNPSESIAEKANPPPFPTPPPPALNAPNPDTSSVKAAPPVSKQPAPSLEDTARSIPKQYWADMAASLQAKPVEPVVEKPKPAPIPLAQTPAAPA